MFKVKRQYLGRDVRTIKRESRIGYATLSKMMGVSESALRMWTSKEKASRQINEKYSPVITEVIVGLNEKKSLSSIEQGLAGGDCHDEVAAEYNFEIAKHEKLSNAAKKAWITRKKNLAKQPKQIKANGHIINEAADAIAATTARLFKTAEQKLASDLGGIAVTDLPWATNDVKKDKKRLEIERLKTLSDDMLSLVFRRIVFTDDKIDALCRAMVSNFREAQ